jgi:hypothetical protein
MPVTPQTSSFDRLLRFNIVPDIILLLLYFFYLHPLMAWQQQHPALSCTLLMLLNIAAVGLGSYIFFTAYADDDELVKYKNTLTTFEGSALGLSAFISCFAFCWWLVPFAAVKKMGVTDTGFILGAMVYFITYMAVVAGSVNNKKGIKMSHLPVLKTVNSAVTIIFFFFSYAFLLMTMHFWQPGFMAAPYLAIICLFIFYLPLRFFLLLRPPFHKLEYVSFILVFGFLIFELFMEL